MKATHLSAILDIEFNSAHNNTPVMIWGAPGIGKSAIVSSIAKKYNAKMIDIRLSQMEPSDLRGIPFQNNNIVDWAVPSMLPDKKRHGDKGILFLDEITSALPSVSAAAYQLILDRKLGNYTLPDGWVIFAAGNRVGDRGISYVMPTPLANRFSHYTLDVNLDDWVLWAYQNNIDERIIAFLRYRPEHLFSFDNATNPIAFASPRTWEFASRALIKFAKKPSILLPSLSGCVGEAIAIELVGFIKNLEEMPNLDDIINGKEVLIPESIDLQYAICTAIVGRAIGVKNNKNQAWNNVLNFATNFKQQELGVMLVSDMVRSIGDEIFTLDSFDIWANKLSDVIFD